MNNENFNPLIKAVQSLRKIALDLENTNSEIQLNDKEIRLKIEDAGKLIVSVNDASVSNIWLKEKSSMIENANKLIELINNIGIKLKNKDVSNLTAMWDQHFDDKENLINNLQEMKKIV
jgi:hypothetical protein